MSSEEEPSFHFARTYTGPEEASHWWFIRHWIRDDKARHGPRSAGISKLNFCSRRDLYGHTSNTQAFRTRIGNNDDVGTLLRITNTYALIGDDGSENFCSVLEGDLPKISVVKSAICGCRVVGCMTAGNKYGLIVPEAIYNTELQQIKEGLPDSVEVRKVEERLSALGNVIACNDKVALIHPELDKESEEIIGDTLQVEVFRHMISDNPLVGSYCVLNNNGGLVHADIGNGDLEDVATLLELPLRAGTVNRGNKSVASGLVANDLIAYAGMKTTAKEFTSIEAAFQFRPYRCAIYRR